MEDLTFGDLLTCRARVDDPPILMVLGPAPHFAAGVLTCICLHPGKTKWQLGMSARITMNDWRKLDASTRPSADKTL